MKLTWLIIAALAIGTAVASTDECSAQRRRPSKSSQSKSQSDSIPTGIAWYGVLADGIADAKATNRPILMLSAAPQCAGIPGMW